MQHGLTNLRHVGTNTYYNIVRIEIGGSIYWSDFDVMLDLVTLDMLGYELTIAVITHSNGDMYTTKNWQTNQPRGFDQVGRCDWVNITTGQDAVVINSIPISPIDTPMGIDNVSRITKDAYEYFEDILLNRVWLQEDVRRIVNGHTDYQIVVNKVTALLLDFMKESTVIEIRIIPDFAEEAMWHMIKSIDWSYVSSGLINAYESLPKKDKA